MFICYDCSKNIGPKIKAVKTVVLTRDKEYHNVRTVVNEFDVEHKEKVDSKGFETVREVDLCPECGQVEVPAIRLPVKGGGLHEEKLVATQKAPLIAYAVQSALERVSHVSERAKRDTAVAIPTIKRFVDDNPQFVF